MKYLYSLKVKIICTIWAYKLGLKYKELHGIYLALNQMILKNK